MLLCCHWKTDLLSFKLCIQVKPVWSEMVWIWQVTQINCACVPYLWPDHFLHLLVLYVWSHVRAHLHWAAPWRLLLPTRGKAVPRHEMDGEENHSEILLHIKCGWATQHQGFEVADKSSHYYRLKDVKWNRWAGHLVRSRPLPIDLATSQLRHETGEKIPTCPWLTSKTHAPNHHRGQDIPQELLQTRNPHLLMLMSILP